MFEILIVESYKYPTIPPVLTEIEIGPDASQVDYLTIVYWIFDGFVCVSPTIPAEIA